MSADLLTPATSDLFGITFFDKMTAAQRELDLRRRVYPRRVEEGKMTQDAASRQVALMQSIVDDYALLAAVHAQPVMTCKAIGTRLSTEGSALIVETLIERPKDVPRRVDLEVRLNGYMAVEIARWLVDWCASYAGDNWRRVVAAFDGAKAKRGEA